MNFENELFQENEHSEISLTPLIDTLLVLLIIFIASTPVINNMIKVSLSNGSYCESKNKKNTICFAIDQYGKIYNDKKNIITKNEIIENFKKIKENLSIYSVVIYVDKDSLSGNLIELIDTLKNLGIYNIYFVTKKIII